MAVDETRFRSLDEKVRQILGEDDGATFMEIVSERPTDMATKHDTDALREALARFEARIDHRFEVLDLQWSEHLERELRQFTMRLTTMMATFVMGGMALAAGIARISV